MKREFLQQCQKYKHQLVMSWMRSEKLDGIRCFWDGGLFRGCMTPWDSRKATGLWTRYCKVISAPEWFLDMLPLYPLDGELWCGYGTRQETMSIVTRHEPDDRWRKVKYMVFTIPNIEKIFANGSIDYRLGNKKITVEFNNVVTPKGDDRYFIERYQDLLVNMPRSENLQLVTQTQIPKTIYLRREIEDVLNQVVEDGGEGLVFQNPISRYNCERSWDALKYKPYDDAEGMVVGTIYGYEKNSSWIKSLSVEWQGKRFCVSGLTDVERQIEWPVGKMITFRYRGLTDDGIPCEARYYRKAVLI